MAHLTIRVPAAHVEAVRDSVLHAYTATAEALHEAVNRQLEAGEAMDDVLGLRVELADLDEALEQLGLASVPAGDTVEITAHPEVLSDAVHGALTDGIEQLRSACADLWRGSGTADAARYALTTVAERLELLVSIQDGDG